MNNKVLGRQLDKIEIIIERHIYVPKMKNELMGMLGGVRLRNQNVRLNLAVIGQFSSGKSTFINALLQQNLLVAKNLVSTAAATFIQLANYLTLNVSFSDGSSFRATEFNFKELSAYIEKKYRGKSPHDCSLHTMVRLLTTNSEIAQTVTSLKIGYPFSNVFLTDLTIIDTPGLFAGEEQASRHEEITRDVINNSADLAIFLIPAKEAISRDMMEFIKQLPKHIFDYCVFIISRMDMVESDEERQEISTFVSNIIRRDLKIPEPFLYSCSALSRLPLGGKIFPDDDERKFWSSSFEDLQTMLRNTLEINRATIISARLGYLTSHLVDEIKNELQSEKKLLSEELVTLKALEVKDLDEALRPLLESALAAIDKKGKNILGSVKDLAGHCGHLKERAAHYVYSAGTDIYGNHDRIERKLQEDMRTHLENIIRTLNAELKQLQNICLGHSKKFQEQFNLNYANLQFLGVSNKVDPIHISKLNMPSYDFNAFRSEVVEKNNVKVDGQTNGVLWGVIIGAAVAGPIGALFGAVLLGITGKQVAEIPIETLQAQLIPMINTEIERCMKEALNIMAERISFTIEFKMGDFERMFEQHRTSYGADIKALITANNKKQGYYESRLRAADEDIRTLIEIQNSISTK